MIILSSRFRARALTGALSAAIIGLGGGLGHPARAQTATGGSTIHWTTNGTRHKTSKPSPSITENAGATWNSTYDPPATYPGTYTYPTRYLTTADGAKLAVLVTVPADASGNPVPGRFPVVLQETDYNSSLSTIVSQLLEKLFPPLGWLGSVIGAYDPYVVRHGYVGVSVDGRGTGNSTGVWTAFDPAFQRTDDLQVLDWIVAQPWSDGRIGVFGVSDVGVHAWLLAETGHPAIKAVMSTGSAGDVYRDVAFTGGQGNLLFFATWFSLTAAVSAINPQLLSDPLTAIPTTLSNLNNALTKFEVPVFVKALLGDPSLAYDGDFFEKRSPLENTDAIKVPAFIVTTQHDVWQRGMPLMYEALKHRVTTKMLVGSGTHAEMALQLFTTGDGVPMLSQLQLRWFDQYVKGLPVGADTLPNVTQRVPGFEHMATATDWPHPQASARRYYLRGDGRLDTAAPTTSVFEPNAPRPLLQQPFSGLCSISTSQWTLGALSLLPIPCFGNSAFTELFNLVYQTPVLTQDLYINGPMQADVWASTTNSGAAISVRVDDVDLLGNATPISNGLLDARYQTVDTTRSRYLDGQMIQPWHSFTEASAKPVVPGQVNKYSVEIFPGSRLLKAGHRLRVAIGPSNPAQGVPVGDQIPLQTPIGTMTVYNDVNHPSSLVVPVVPASVLPWY